MGSLKQIYRHTQIFKKEGKEEREGDGKREKERILIIEE